MTVNRCFVEIMTFVYTMLSDYKVIATHLPSAPQSEPLAPGIAWLRVPAQVSGDFRFILRHCFVRAGLRITTIDERRGRALHGKSRAAARRTNVPSA
jgi:hypothetical protein